MIHFFSEDISFKVPNIRQTKAWLKATAQAEGFKLNQLNYIFCSDEYLLGVNRQYLNHDFYTDIITFDNGEIEGEIEGDIFVSIERVRENATEFKKTFEEELKRVLVHGVLHLSGYGDKTEEEEKTMREKENFYLHLY
ncbi:MAG: rRNA maturation RNase YbeY [Runella slithyformis]|nr:MAG: rRNA maturation RNase YbeY [Runella slithyformis]TAF28180.1 MAG: rRNA maturation RNase YbeY [Runella slithyformis]TAF46828.1 MAG: rRNA maturation RNase YbeY [Runella slithyformis]TAF81855.1 MAG: rRNA maturation RNase YbeY [Runella slithyformis]TAH06544.1 MAG: rRNA maturation RNase YbeY [Runella slithyformis]